MNTSIKRSLFIAAGIAALLNVPGAKASNLALEITINTSALVLDSTDSASGEYFLDLEFNNNSNESNVTNTVTLSNFNFGGGSADLSNTDNTGDVSGNPAGTVTLSDGGVAGSNVYNIGFYPGDTLSFLASIPTVGQPAGADPEGAPEGFLVAIQDQSYYNIATTEGGLNDLFEATLPYEGSGLPLTYNSYSSTGGPDAAGDTTHPGEAGVTTAAVPEPSTYAGLGLGMAVLLAFGRKVRRMRA